MFSLQKSSTLPGYTIWSGPITLLAVVSMASVEFLSTVIRMSSGYDMVNASFLSSVFSSTIS